MPTIRLMLVLWAGLAGLVHAEPGRKPTPQPDLGAKEDALVIEEEVTVETCYKLPAHTVVLQQTQKALFPLPEVGQRKNVGGNIWFREKSERICQYPDEATFKQFEAVRQRLSTAEK